MQTTDTIRFQATLFREEGGGNGEPDWMPSPGEVLRERARMERRGALLTLTQAPAGTQMVATGEPPWPWLIGAALWLIIWPALLALRLGGGPVEIVVHRDPAEHAMGAAKLRVELDGTLHVAARQRNGARAVAGRERVEVHLEDAQQQVRPREIAVEPQGGLADLPRLELEHPAAQGHHGLSR